MSWQKKEAVEVGRISEIEDLSTGEHEYIVTIKNNYLVQKRKWLLAKDLFSIGEFVRIQNGQILGKLFISSISTQEFSYLLNHFFTFKTEELEQYHCFLTKRYASKKDDVNYASIFMHFIVHYNYKQNIDVIMQNPDVSLLSFLRSSYTSKSFKKRIQCACKELSISKLDDFFLTEKEIKDLTGSEIEEIIEVLKCYNSKEEKQDAFLPRDFFALLFHYTSEGVKDYLNHLANRFDILNHMLCLSGIYLHDDICSEIHELHLLQMFQHLKAIDSKKAQEFCDFVLSLDDLRSTHFLFCFWNFFNESFYKQENLQKNISEEVMRVKAAFCNLLYERWGIVLPSLEEKEIKRKKHFVKKEN